MSKPIKNIPIKRVAIKSEEQWMQIPDRSMMGMTPNGNNFIGTTPGGTRVVYDRVYLWQQKNSPLSRTPTHDMPVIPGITTEIDDPRHHHNSEDEDNSRKTSSDSNNPSAMQTINETEEHQLKNEENDNEHGNNNNNINNNASNNHHQPNSNENERIDYIEGASSDESDELEM